MLEAKAKGTGASVLQKKKVIKIFFQAISKKRSLQVFRNPAFSNEIFMIQKIVLSLAEDRAILKDL